MAMPVFVECFLIAIHEIPEYVSMIDIDHHKHLVFRRVSADERETIRPIRIKNPPNLQRVEHRIHCKFREALSSVGSFLNDM